MEQVQQQVSFIHLVYALMAVATYMWLMRVTTK